MADGTPIAPPKPMPLSHVRDALSDLVTAFCNEMRRRNVREMTASEWADEFRRWIDPYDFEREYQRTLDDLARYERSAP